MTDQLSQAELCATVAAKRIPCKLERLMDRQSNLLTILTTALLARWLLVFKVLAIVVVTLNPVIVQAQVLPDLTPVQWSRDTSLAGIKIDRYKSNTGAISIDLMAFPATDQSAREWTESFIYHMTAADRSEGLKIHIIDDAELGIAKGPLASSSNEADIASYTVMILRPGEARENSMVGVRSIVRDDNPVQLSLVSLRDGTASDTEWAAADKIRFDARLPVNESAAFLGLEAMISVMTEPLLNMQNTEPLPKADVQAKQGSEKNQNQSTSAKPVKPSGILPPGFHNIWFIYNRNSGARWTAMTFRDGTLTTDVNAVIDKGVLESKRSKPNRWATFKTSKKGEQIVARFPNWSKPKKYFITDRSIKMSNAFKLTGCFSAQSGSTLGMDGVAGSSTFTSSEFCFNRNGRFSNDRSTVISGSAPSSLGTALRESQGTYRINGNTIVLSYASGRKLRTVFGAYRFGEPAPTLTAISIGQRMFFK